MNNNPAEERAVWIYKKIIRLYPKSFRASFGILKVRTFKDYYRDATAHGDNSGMRFWSELIADEARQVIKEHCEEMKAYIDYSRAIVNIGALTVGVSAGMLSAPYLLRLTLATELVWALAGVTLGIFHSRAKSGSNITGALYGVALSFTYWFLLRNVTIHAMNLSSSLFVIILVGGLGAFMGIMLTRLGAKIYQWQHFVQVKFHGKAL